MLRTVLQVRKALRVRHKQLATGRRRAESSMLSSGGVARFPQRQLPIMTAKRKQLDGAAKRLDRTRAADGGRIAPCASCGPRGICGKQVGGMQVDRGETKAIPSQLQGARSFGRAGWRTTRDIDECSRNWCPDGMMLLCCRTVRE